MSAPKQSMGPSKGPRIIVLDIETSPIIAYVWGLFKQFVGLEQILQDWSVLSYCAKTLGNPKIRYMDVSKQRNFYDDRRIMKALWKELDEADIVVTQNGIRFDHKKINARFLCLGMPPPSPYKMVDTMVEAKNIAAMTSNKLAWLSRALTTERKSDHGSFPGFLLWAECLKGNKLAWEEMRKYNPQDVISTEEVYLKLRPYMIGHPNVNIYDDSEEVRCPNCGSNHVHKRGTARTQVGTYQRYQCGGCGAWSRSGYMNNTLAKRKSLLRN